MARKIVGIPVFLPSTRRSSFRKSPIRRFRYRLEIIRRLARSSSEMVRSGPGKLVISICSGVINNELNGPNITAVPLDVDDCMEIGYLLHKRTVPNRFTEAYIDALRRHGVPIALAFPASTKPGERRARRSCAGLRTSEIVPPLA